MQIMEGDIIRTIRENIQYFAHEYTPTKDALQTLEKMVKICEV